MTTVFQEIIRRMGEATSVLILTHDRPDGDAIGSLLALGMLLENEGKHVELLNQDPVPESLAFLPGSEKIRCAASEAGDVIACDLVVVLDAAGRDRIGQAVWNRVPEGVYLINIDHHISNTEFGDLNCVDAASPATGQIVFQLARAAGWKLSVEIATNLYAAVSTDTGGFRYPLTTAVTMRIGADLIDAGVEPGWINQMLYENYPRRRVEALRLMLGEMRFDFDGRCVSLTLPLPVSRELDLKPGDTEGAIDIVRAVDTAVVAVYFEELPGNLVRVSARSKSEGFSVGQLCASFGGGGHSLAAGARVPGPLEIARERILTAIGAKLGEK